MAFYLGMEKVNQTQTDMADNAQQTEMLLKEGKDDSVDCNDWYNTIEFINFQILISRCIVIF